MSNRFIDCLEFVLLKEGGKVDDPTDRGGRTCAGVTQATYDAYRLKLGFPAKDVWDIAVHEIKDIYLQSYWSPLCCSQLPKGLDLAVFDWGVNTGVKRAAKHLQMALGMDAGEIDGAIGQKTLRYVHDVAAANEVDQVIRRFNDLRLDFYNNLVMRDPSQSKFIRGWENRVAAVQHQIYKDIA